MNKVSLFLLFHFVIPTFLAFLLLDEPKRRREGIGDKNCKSESE